MTQIRWVAPVSDDFSKAGRWSPAVVPGPSDDALLNASGATLYTVTASTNQSVHSIQTLATATLSITVPNGSGGFFTSAGTGTGANAGTIAVGNNSNLVAGGTINNTGTISLNSVGNVTSLQVEATGLTLIGAGKLFMSDNSQNQIFGDTSTATLTNKSTIVGAGRIGNGQTVLPGAGGLVLVNATGGVIESSGANQLIINTGANTVTNTGLLESLGAGGLLIQTTTVNNVGGTITGASGTSVQLQSADIIGGEFNSSGTGGAVTTAPNDRGDVLDGTTSAISNDGVFNIANNTSLTIQGTINNTLGKLNLKSVGNVTDLVISAKNAILMGGTVTMTDNSQNFIVGTLTGPRHSEVVSTLTNSGTIIGSGQIGNNLSLTNNSLIDATGAQQLIVATGSSVPAGTAAGGNIITNNGTFESTNPGKLAAVGGLILSNVTVNNNKTTGLIEANGAHTHVDLQTADIVGGTLETFTGGVIDTAPNDRGSLLDGLTTTPVFNQGALVLNNNTTLAIQGFIENTGTISLASIGNVTTLNVTAKSATLVGSFVNLSDNTQNFITGTLTGPRNGQSVSSLTNNSVIQGAGQIGGNLALTNELIIDATGGSALTVATGNINVPNSNILKNEHGAILEATNPGKLSTTGGLLLSNITVSNFNGSGNGFIEANGAHTHVDLQSAVINGGVIKSSLGGVVETAANDRGSVLNGHASPVFNETTIDIQNNTSLTIAGQISNAGGALALNSVGNVTQLVVAAGGASLVASGNVDMSDNSQNFIISSPAGSGGLGVLSNVNNTIFGAGQLGGGAAGQLSLNNEAAGVIDATGSINALIINTGANTVTNAGLIEADGNAGLVISGATVNSSTGGKFEANNTSSISLTSSTLIGGTFLPGNGTGEFQAGANDFSSVLDGVTSTINNEATFNLNNNSGLTLQGNINNTGSFNLNSGGNTTELIIDATNVTLTGAGSVALGSNAQNFIVGATAASTLTNVNNTISGGGQVGDGSLTLINDKAGVIDADTAGQMILNVGATTAINNGLIEATNTGGLLIQNSVIDSTGGGTFDSESTISLGNAFLVGGTLNGAGAFQTAANDFLSVFDGVKSAFVNNTTVNIGNNSAITLQGAIHNTAAGSINLQSTGNITQLVVDTTGATLSGGGAISMSNNTQNFIVGNTSASTLTNVDNTISGSGDVGDGSMILINSKAGVIDATNPSTLTIDTGANTVTNAGTIQADATATEVINSAVANSGTILANGGDIVINGVISGAGAVTIASGEIEFTGPNVATNVTFTSTNGELRLDQSQTYTGTVTGFSTAFGTTFDLSDIGFVSAGEATFVGTTSGGTLTVTDGTHTAHIKLVGNYTGSTFTASSDGHGGTSVTDPPKAPAVAAPVHSVTAAPHQMVAAMAAFGPTSGVGAHIAMAAHEARLPMLAASMGMRHAVAA